MDRKPVEGSDALLGSTSTEKEAVPAVEAASGGSVPEGPVPEDTAPEQAPAPSLDEPAEDTGAQDRAVPEGTVPASSVLKKSAASGTDEQVDGAGVNEQPAARGPGRSRRAARRLAAVSVLPLMWSRSVLRLPRAAGLSARAKRVTLAVLVGLVVLTVAGSAVLGWRAASDAAVDRAETQALDAARTKMPIVLSYRAESLADDLGRAREQLTGQFAQEYEQIASSVISPATTSQQITTTATVSRAAVISAAADRVETLLFVNQSTTSKDQPTPQNTASQVRVTLTRSAGQWLISDVQPL
jgi:Mce-associated membrane protein